MDSQKLLGLASTVYNRDYHYAQCHGSREATSEKRDKQRHRAWAREEQHHRGQQKRVERCCDRESVETRQVHFNKPLSRPGVAKLSFCQDGIVLCSKHLEPRSLRARCGRSRGSRPL